MTLCYMGYNIVNVQLQTKVTMEIPSAIWTVPILFVGGLLRLTPWCSHQLLQPPPHYCLCSSIPIGWLTSFSR